MFCFFFQFEQRTSVETKYKKRSKSRQKFWSPHHVSGSRTMGNEMRISACSIVEQNDCY